MTMMVKDRMQLSGRLLAVSVLFGAAAFNAAWAEDAVPNTAPASSRNGNSDAGSPGSATTKGNETAGSDKPVSDKADAGSEGSAEHHAGSRDGSKGGEEGANKGPQHGEDHAVAKQNGTEANPIDTRITVLGKPRSGRLLSWHDRKKAKLARQLATSGDHHPKFTRSNKYNVVRNAIGQRLPLTKGAGNGMDKKGLETTSSNGLPSSAGATGAGQNGGAAAGGPNPQHQGFVPVPARDGRLPALPLNASANRSIINGTGMVRPGVRIGAIGGATKNVSGALNGTDFHPRHP